MVSNLHYQLKKKKEIQVWKLDMIYESYSSFDQCVKNVTHKKFSGYTLVKVKNLVSIFSGIKSKEKSKQKH